MNRNLTLYPWYYAATSFLAWMPVFFMYFSERLSLAEVLQLEAFYYVAVVILEVPSGYFSDRIGRKKTLLMGAIFLCAALIAYIFGTNVFLLGVGQFLFAAHIAFISGTNTVFHYESLIDEGLEQEYGTREAMINKWSLISGAIGALLGGWLGSYDLVYAYWLSLILAVVSFVTALLFSEPLISSKSHTTFSFASQLRQTFTYLQSSSLFWIVSFYLVMYVMVHVPYEFYQPVLSILDEKGMLTLSSASMMSGVLYAGAMFIGAVGAAYSITWKNAIGLKGFLFLMAFIMIAVIGLMGFVLHPVIVMVIMMRSFSWSAVKAPIFEIITPQIDAQHRATFYSMISLVSRLGFFALLLILSFFSTHGDTDWPSVSLLLKISLGIGMVALIPILIWSRKIKMD